MSHTATIANCSASDGFGLKANLACRFRIKWTNSTPGKDRVGGLLRFEPEHRFGAAFDPSVILFNTVVTFGLSVVSQGRIAARFVWLRDAPEITRRNAMHEGFSPVALS